MLGLKQAVLTVFVTLALSGCGGGGGGTSGGSSVVLPSVPPTIHANDVIKHVVVIVQENRSFDNLFHNFPGADTVSSGSASDGSTIPLRPVSFAFGIDPNHDYGSFKASLNGGVMNGFDQIGAFPHAAPLIAYSYVPQNEVQPYFDLASAYALSDRTFQSNNAASYGAHQYLIAGQSGGATNVPSGMPWGCDAPAGSVVPTLAPDGTFGTPLTPCFDYQTVGDSLDRANVTWAYYAPTVIDPSAKDVAGAIWSPYDAIRHIRYGSDWAANQIAPETTILDDIASSSLRGVSIVSPDGYNSDHARFPSTTGPAWVASIVQAIGASRYWKDTAIFVIWDDWGGWYDHVRPPYIDQNGAGFRVPLIAISPYAKHGYVSHVQLETASVTHFIEEVFGLPSLGQRDATSNPPDDMFDYTQSVKPLSGIRLASSALRAASHRAPSHLPPDD